MTQRATRKILLILVIIAFLGGCTSQATRNRLELSPDQPQQPPVAKIVPHMLEIHGQVLVDNYAWLKDPARTNREVIAYLDAENAYTDWVLRPTQNLRKKIFDEMVARIKEDDTEPPIRRDDWWYYARMEKGSQYALFCRKKGSLESPEEIYLDVNKLAKGKTYFAVEEIRVSPDHRFLAYTVDTSGEEYYTLYFKDLKTGKMLPDKAERVASVAWANDNATLLYITVDDAKRSDRLFRHRLGDTVAQDALLFHEPDERFYLKVHSSESRKYLIVDSVSETTSEVRLLEADHPENDLMLLQPREQDVIYSVSPHADKLFILTNANEAKNYQVMTTTIDQPDRAHWQPFVATDPAVYLSHLTMFRDYLVISERTNGLEERKIYDFSTGQFGVIPFPEPVYSLSPRENATFDATVFRFQYSSLVTPSTIYDYDMKTRQLDIKKREEVLGGYRPANYHSDRLFATAADGTKIPISIVYRVSLFTADGHNPLMMEGYGAYGDSSDPYFMSMRLSLLDRGFVYAIAHVRGGGEYGQSWYEQGRLLTKKNSFTDFIASAEYLVNHNYTSRDRLVIQGGSAGGLLVGAATTMRPDLFAVVIADVPFVDVINSMLDPSLMYTVTEYEEWGNPNEKASFDYMLSYSPYDNTKAQHYPNMLVLAGFYDPRVNYWEPAKWVARLRATKTDNNLLLLKTNMQGHLGASGRFDQFDQEAMKYAFILDRLGIKN